MIKKYLSTFLFAGLDIFNKMVSTLVVSVIISRILTVREFGSYNYYVFLLTFILSLTKLGLENILLLEFAKNKQFTKYSYFSNSIVLRLITSVAAVLFLTILKNQLHLSFSQILLLALPLIISVVDFSELFFLSRQNNKLLSLGKLFLAITSLSLRLYILLFPIRNALSTLIYLYVLDYLLLSLWYLVLIKKHKLYIRLSFVKREILLKLLNRGVLLLGAGLSIFLIMRINVFFIERYCTMYDLGLYSPAIRLCEVFNTLSVLLINVATPLLVSKQYAFDRIINNFYSSLFWVSAILIIPILFYASPLITFLFGKAYWQGADVLRITVLSVPFVSVGMLYSRVLISQEKDKHNFYRMILSGIFSVVLSFFLIKVWGITGAAYSYLISQIFSNFIVDLFINDIRIDFFNKIKCIVNPIAAWESLKLLRLQILNRNA